VVDPNAQLAGCLLLHVAVREHLETQGKQAKFAQWTKNGWHIGGMLCNGLASSTRC